MDIILRVYFENIKGFLCRASVCDFASSPSNANPICKPLLLLLPLSGSSLSRDELADEYIVPACPGKNGSGGVVVAR